MSFYEFEALCKEAVQCRYCFEQLGVCAPVIDIAQPRWVGPDYWEAKPRVLVVLLNPGSGDYRADPADYRSRKLIQSFACGEGELQEFLDHQRYDMPNWGRGRFYNFYINSLGLNIDSTAFANVAWCATQGNNCPTLMLSTCFSRFTERLLRVLKPQVVLLSGSKTHSFYGAVREIIPDAGIIRLLHYAHRSGRKAEEEEVNRVVELIAVQGV